MIHAFAVVLVVVVVVVVVVGLTHVVVYMTVLMITSKQP
jgi:hypothetical protein